jgi:hypothetical protein
VMYGEARVRNEMSERRDILEVTESKRLLVGSKANDSSTALGR